MFRFAGLESLSNARFERPRAIVFKDLVVRGDSSNQILWLDKSCIESSALCPSQVTVMSLLGPSHPFSFLMTKGEQRELETFTELVSC